MNAMFYSLDAGGAALFYLLIGAGIVFIILAVLIEALVMLLMKYHTLRKAIVQSLVVNLVSMIGGFFLLQLEWDWFNLDSIEGFIGMFLITLIIEGLILYLFNKTTWISRTILVILVMNIITYFVLFFFSDLS
jgi:hypothetical protein